MSRHHLLFISVYLSFIIHHSINELDWKSSIQGFKNYLRLERSMSGNTIDAYLRDIHKFVEFLQIHELETLHH